MTAASPVQGILDKLTLDSGGHTNFDEGVCLLEAASYIAGEPWSDHPKCVSPFLGAYGRRLNDRLSDEDRQKLKPFIPGLLHTAGDGQEDARRWMAVDWAVRVATPRILDAANLTVHAANLRRLDPVVDRATADAARSIARAARDEAYALRVKARAALQERVKAELEKRGVTADAAADAVAVADADVVAVADAVAAAVADVVADVVAVADIPKGSRRWWDIYYAVRAKLDPIYRAAVDTSKYAEVARINNAEAIELLGRMIDPKSAVAL